jgi:hypothetical protein
MESSPDYKKQALLYGLIFGIFNALLLYFNYKFQLEDTLLLSFLSLTVAILIVFFPIHQYKLDNSNFLKLSEALKIGLIIGLIGGLIYAAYTYFHYTQLETDFVSKILEENNKAIESEKTNMTQEQINQAKELSSAFVSPFSFATINLISILMKSFIISLVLGLIKKN